MGNAVTVNGERYRNMISTFLEFQLEVSRLRNIWYQQDGATSHIAREIIFLLNPLFPQILISRHGDVNWPPISPEAIPDFYLWGYIKEKVYINKSDTISQLKRNIQEENREVNGNTLTKATENVEKKLEICCRENGRHLKEIVFHT